MNDLYMLMYTSLLALDASPSCVIDIVRRSRINNHNRDITGILIFDGAAFCQYLEGSAEAVGALMKKILVDPRHTDVKIILEGFVSPPRRFDDWSMAYGLANNETVADIAESGDRTVAQQRFAQLLSSIDREPHP